MYADNQRTHVFTTAWPELPQANYSGSFALNAQLDHGGDYSEAAAALRREGYGANRTANTASTGASPAPTTAGLQPVTEAWRELVSQGVDWSEFWSRDHQSEDWLLKPLLAKGRLHSITAEAKAGKSMLALEACAAMATGQEFLQREAADAVGVLYVD